MYRFILILILISNFSHSQKKMKIPPYLKKGDTVAIVCTARKFFPEDAKPAIELLESWGLKAKLGKTIGLDSCQLGGTDTIEPFSRKISFPSTSPIRNFGP